MMTMKDLRRELAPKQTGSWDTQREGPGREDSKPGDGEETEAGGPGAGS